MVFGIYRTSTRQWFCKIDPMSLKEIWIRSEAHAATFASEAEAQAMLEHLEFLRETLEESIRARVGVDA